MSGTYVSVKPTVSSSLRLRSIIKKLSKHCKLYPVDAFHVTLLYSKSTVDNAKSLLKPSTSQFSAIVTALEYFPGHDDKGYLVATMLSDDLHTRHAFWLKNGGKHTYTPYAPHLTLAENVPLEVMQSSLVKELNAYFKSTPLGIRLHNETQESLNEDWTGDTDK